MPTSRWCCYPEFNLNDSQNFQLEKNLLLGTLGVFFKLSHCNSVKHYLLYNQGPGLAMYGCTCVLIKIVSLFGENNTFFVRFSLKCYISKNWDFTKICNFHNNSLYTFYTKIITQCSKVG